MCVWYCQGGLVGERIRCLATTFGGKKPTCYILYIFSDRTSKKQDFSPKIHLKGKQLDFHCYMKTALLYYYMSSRSVNFEIFLFLNSKPLHPLSITPWKWSLAITPSGTNSPFSRVQSQATVVLTYPTCTLIHNNDRPTVDLSLGIEC